MSTELILGSRGFIGSNYHASESNPLRPSSLELDITKKESIVNFLKANSQIKTIIDFAGYTNTKLAQKQIGNFNSESWKINVLGTRNLAEICQDMKIFLIFISTDSVFYDKLGPSNENEIPKNNGEVDWYGHTKLVAEMELQKNNEKHAIIRISYPFGDSTKNRDYCRKILNTIASGYPLFNDQYFTPSYIPDVSKLINKVAVSQKTGTFHAVCSGITTPYQIGLYLKRCINLECEIKLGSLENYENVHGRQTFAAKGGLKNDITSKILNYTFLTWEEALDKYCKDYKSNLPNI